MVTKLIIWHLFFVLFVPVPLVTNNCNSIWKFLLVVPSISHVAASVSRSAFKRSSTPSTTSNNNDKKKKKLLNAPNRFVSAAPLVIAAVCEDGISLIAFHLTTADNSLLFEQEEEEMKQSNNNNNNNNKGEEEEPHKFRDLSDQHLGALRIMPLDEEGTALVCVGWRTDCNIFTSQCRSIAARERDQYGTRILQDEEESIDTRRIRSFSYGHFLANEAFKWMAQCHYSENVRGLSCVGIVTTPEGYLSVVDATGAYRARAHALGHGSNIVNQRLMGIDFSNLTVDECTQKIMTIAKEECFVQTDNKEPILPNNVIVEIVHSTATNRFKRVKFRDIMKSVPSDAE